jgi:hypothetical protein
VLKKKIELTKLDQNEREEKRLFTELQKTYDPRRDSASTEGILENKGQLLDELSRLEKLIWKKRTIADRKNLESDVKFYENILQKRVS